jgi:hypothetical protein
MPVVRMVVSSLLPGLMVAAKRRLLWDPSLTSSVGIRPESMEGKIHLQPCAVFYGKEAVMPNPGPSGVLT